MQEERPVFNSADRQIMQSLFNKMVDLLSNNKQIFQQTRRVVREDEEFNEGVKDTSDFKVVTDAEGNTRKVKAHRVVLTKNAPQVSDAETFKEEVEQLDEDLRFVPPPVLVLRRKEIRMFSNETRIALYYNDKIKKYFTVPYSVDRNLDSVIQAEETQIEEAVDAMSQLQKIKDSHSYGTVNHKDGTASKVDVQTAHAVLMVHKSLNDDNKKKFADMVSRSAHHMQKAANFATSKVK